MRMVHVTSAMFLFALVPALPALARTDITSRLGFETFDLSATRKAVLPGGPSGTLFVDSVIVHSGKYSCRIDRDGKSPSDFSTVTFVVPVDFTGHTLGLKGWLRRENVVGWTGLWLREDASGGPVQFDNMQQRQLAGTADWTAYEITLPLDPKVQQVVFGALCVGTGRMWIDDLQIVVDGKPLPDVPETPRVLTIMDRDTSMDASSGITLDHASSVQVDNLTLLGKVWGFLKYHHPAVVRGERQWDFDLFRVLPGVLAARDAAGAQRAMSAWIDSLGPVKACSSCVKLPQGRAMAPRIAWIRDRARLGTKLSTQLMQAYENRPDVPEQFFVSQVDGIGNPDFSNERAYNRQRDPDAGYRLLALFRYWNMVEYWFPNRDVMDGDWNATLHEFVPRLLAATSHDAYAREMMALITRISDTHANLWSSISLQPPGGSAALPVTLRLVEHQAIVVDYANPRLGPASGLRIGDIITHVDGVPVDTLLARWRPMYAVSNDASRQRDMARGLTRGEPGMAILSVRRGDQEIELMAARAPRDSLDRTRESRHDHPGATLRRLSDDLVYLKLSTVADEDVGKYLDAMKGAKAIVIDIRNYPSAFMVFALGQHLVKRETNFVKFTTGDLKNPGSFDFHPPLSLKPEAPYIDGAVAILVDEVTQSQAEYTTMAFRARPGAVVVGSQTAGADGNVSRIALPGGESTMFSGIGVFYPDGRPTQRVGIVPDFEAKPTIAGIRAGRDEVLEAAVRRVLGRDITVAELASLSASTN